MRARIALLFLILAALACMQPVTTPTPPAPALTPTPRDPLPTRTATATAPATGTSAEVVQTAEVRAATVNVRAKPGGKVVGQVYAGQSVEITGECADGWCPIAEPEGWIFEGCLEGSERRCEVR